MNPGKVIRARLQSLEEHLRLENPVLVSAVQSFRQLDRIGYAMGLLGQDESFATRIPWWPMISVLGTFSAGKSTFINHYLGYQLQPTGNQAVDDKFTVICYSREPEARTLPGLALDADTRFPFYQISNELEKVAKGEGRRVDAYLQLKTCPGKNLRGRILIDSPGFDADSQRTATLRLTSHIIDLSDLVLVFFDARHPEPGAMRDTLTHLVGETIHRSDSSKFVYILNQIDTTAREDNPEEVVGAWQRALAQEGLTAGNFHTIYSPDVAVPIPDEATRNRYEKKRDHDLELIHQRIRQVSVERAYRIIGALEKTADEIRDTFVPGLRSARDRWRRLVLWGDVVVFGVLALALVAIAGWLGYWEGLRFSPPWRETFTSSTIAVVLTLLVAVGAIGYLHHTVRRFAAAVVVKTISRLFPDGPERERMTRAFLRNTRFWHSILAVEPVGWGRRSLSRIRRVLDDADAYVRTLNDTFTDPSGDQPAQEAVAQQGSSETATVSEHRPVQAPPSSSPAD